MGFRNKLKELAESSGLFEVEAAGAEPQTDAASEDPLAAMERLVNESRARVPQPPPEAFSTPPVKAKPAIRLGEPVPAPTASRQAPAAGGGEPAGPIEIDGPPEMLSVDQVYKRAKLVTTPETGTVLKIIVLTADPNLAALPRDTKAAMVRASLAADRVAPEAVVDDAVSRDRALDMAEEKLEERVADFRERADRKVSELEEERERMLADFNSRIAALRQAADRSEDELAAWRRSKTDIERGLFEAVSMVIPDGSANPITLGSAAPAGKQQ
jgi:hypothetical protein